MYGNMASFIVIIFRRKICNDRDENCYGEIAAEIYTCTREKLKN